MGRSYTCLCLILMAAILQNLVQRSVSFHQRWTSPNCFKWVYFEQTMVKTHPICAALGAFSLKMVNWLVGNCAKIWYRESQIFKIRQAYPLAKVPLPDATIIFHDVVHTFTHLILLRPLVSSLYCSVWRKTTNHVVNFHSLHIRI